MATPLSPTRLFQCDGCGATLPLDETQIGKKCRCGRCGKILVVPGFELEKEFQDAPAKEVVPETVAFYCRVCDTRLVAYTNDVGKKAKCPDCGAKNVVPPPPKVKPKRPPRAMHGQQYGLWGVNEAPLPAELLAHQAKFYPVYCRVCDTLMHAHVGQLGKKLKCPDCGAETAVPLPPVEASKPSVLVPEGEEYQLDEQSPPPPRIVLAAATLKPDHRLTLREELNKQYERDKHKLPRVPLVTGVFRMLLRAPVPVWWGTLSCACVLITMLGSATASTITAGLGAIMGLFLLAAVCTLGLLMYTALSAICSSILTDSSEGNDRLYNPPTTDFMEWFGSAGYLLLAFSVSAVPGWLLGQAFDLGAESLVLGAFVCFPIFLLSMLETGSPVLILSPRLLMTLFKRPLQWMLFYLLTGLLLVAIGAAEGKLLEGSATALLVPPLALAVLFVYFRLLGRLAWWLAETMPVDDQDADQEK